MATIHPFQYAHPREFIASWARLSKGQAPLAPTRDPSSSVGNPGTLLLSRIADAVNRIKSSPSAHMRVMEWYPPTTFYCFSRLVNHTREDVQFHSATESPFPEEEWFGPAGPYGVSFRDTILCEVGQVNYLIEQLIRTKGINFYSINLKSTDVYIGHGRTLQGVISAEEATVAIPNVRTYAQLIYDRREPDPRPGDGFIGSARSYFLEMQYVPSRCFNTKSVHIQIDSSNWEEAFATCPPCTLTEFLAACTIELNWRYVLRKALRRASASGTSTYSWCDLYPERMKTRQATKRIPLFRWVHHFVKNYMARRRFETEGLRVITPECFDTPSAVALTEFHNLTARV